MRTYFQRMGVLVMLSVLSLASFGQTDSLTTRSVLLYYMDGKVDSLQVFELEWPEKTNSIYSFTIPNTALNRPLSDKQREYYLSRNQQLRVNGKKIHSIDVEGEVTEVSGSWDIGTNVALCLEQHRLQTRSGISIGLIGGLLTGLGGVVGLENGGLAVSGVGAAVLLTGAIISLDANKWFQKSRTIPKIR